MAISKLQTLMHKNLVSKHNVYTAWKIRNHLCLNYKQVLIIRHQYTTTNYDFGGILYGLVHSIQSVHNI